MSVRMKKPPTNAQCTLAFRGPAAQAEAACAALQALGFRAVEGDAAPGDATHRAARTSKVFSMGHGTSSSTYGRRKGWRTPPR
jgi:hypothetical protein